jgi:hypothetical protein
MLATQSRFDWVISAGGHLITERCNSVIPALEAEVVSVRSAVRVAGSSWSVTVSRRCASRAS